VTPISNTGLPSSSTVPITTSSSNSTLRSSNAKRGGELAREAHAQGERTLQHAASMLAEVRHGWNTPRRRIFDLARACPDRQDHAASAHSSHIHNPLDPRQGAIATPQG
jgi:hypothetical protein